MIRAWAAGKVRMAAAVREYKDWVLAGYTDSESVLAKADKAASGYLPTAYGYNNRHVVKPECAIGELS